VKKVLMQNEFRGQIMIKTMFHMKIGRLWQSYGCLKFLSK